jgi:hypothetical protein
MIKYDDRDQIPTFLLRSSHTGQKFIVGRWRPRPDYFPHFPVFGHDAELVAISINVNCAESSSVSQASFRHFSAEIPAEWAALISERFARVGRAIENA